MLSAELQAVYSPISESLANTELILQRALLSSSDKNVAYICQHILQVKGKRIRPAILFFSYQALRPEDATIPNNVCKIAAAIELIHMASLIHDDIVDQADTRHGQPSVQSKFGQPRAIVVGVLLYAVALQLIAEVGNVPVLAQISERVEDLCKGEISQISERGNFALSTHAYLDILDNKTAALFKAACVSGALLANTPIYPRELEKFGYDLGILFQLTDDFMDMMSTETDLGKHPGQDIFLEELTIPVRLVLDTISIEKRAELIKRIKQKDATIFSEFKQLFIEKKLESEIKSTLESYVDSARNDLRYLPDSDGKQGLLKLVDLVASRF